MNLQLKPFEKQAYKFLLVLTIFSTIAFQLWRTLFNNFAIESIGLGSEAIGLIQAVREIPGFFAFIVVYLILFIKEKWLAFFSMILICIGVAVTGFFPSKWGLLLTTFSMSIGFHFYETINQSLSMQYFSKTNFTHSTAKLKQFGALAAILTGVLIIPLSTALSYQTLYLIFGILSLFGVFYSLRYLPEESYVPEQRKGVVLKRKYWVYYALTFLNGARRQIFTVFALLLLVQRHHMSATIISILFVLNNMMNFFVYPYIAKLIDKWGEQFTLRFEYLSLMTIFLMYALIDNYWFALGLYIVDNLFFAFSLATKSYFQKISDPQDFAPTAGVSFTINHIAAVIIPFVGGLLWQVDWRIPFFLGSFFTVISLFLTHFIQIPDSKKI